MRLLILMPGLTQKGNCLGKHMSKHGRIYFILSHCVTQVNTQLPVCLMQRHLQNYPWAYPLQKSLGWSSWKLWAHTRAMKTHNCWGYLSVRVPVSAGGIPMHTKNIKNVCSNNIELITLYERTSSHPWKAPRMNP